MFFNRETYEFTGAWIINTRIEMPTTLFISKDYFYPASWTFELFVDNQLVQNGFQIENSDKNHLNILFSEYNGKEVTFIMRPINEQPTE